MTLDLHPGNPPEAAPAAADPAASPLAPFALLRFATTPYEALDALRMPDTEASIAVALAAAEAMDTPVTNENSALPSTVAMASRPGRRLSRRLIPRYRSVTAPDFPMNSPISMNNGMTANT